MVWYDASCNRSAGTIAFADSDVRGVICSRTRSFSDLSTMDFLSFFDIEEESHVFPVDDEGLELPARDLNGDPFISSRVYEDRCANLQKLFGLGIQRHNTDKSCRATDDH